MICLPLVLLPLAHAPTLTPPPPTLPAGVTIEQRLVVGMPPGAPLPPILFLVYGATLVDTIPELDAHLLDVPAAVDLDALIALLVGSQGAAYAEGDRNSGSPDTACSQGPGDPWDSAGQQCTIGFADGTPSHKEYKQQSMLRQIRAEQAQAASTGAPNVVAVIDTGVDLGHPTLAGKLVSTGFDYILGVPLAQDAPYFLDDDGDGTVDEGTGHGTHIAGILIEPMQGEGGDNHFRTEFLQALRNYADEREALLMFDEVQTGFFGSGKPWLWQHHGVAPDVVSFGKKTQVCGIYASTRIDEVEDNVFERSSRINSTWGGNLVNMVRCRRFIEIIEEGRLAENVAAQGERMLAGLRTLARERGGIANVRGIGSLVAFTCENPAARDAMIDTLLEQRMLALKSGPRSIRFRLPLVISAEEVDQGLERAEASLPVRV